MIDITTADLMLARNLGCNVLVTHPVGTATINFYKVIDKCIYWMMEKGTLKITRSSVNHKRD